MMNNLSIGKLLIFGLFALLPLSAQNTLMHPINLDFEKGSIGELPVGWHLTFLARELGYNCSTTDSLPFNGKYSMMLWNDGEYKNGMYGSVMQSIDARPYQGRKIRLRATIRAEITSTDGSARLWYREHLNTGEDGNFEFMEENPIILGEWKRYEISGEIEKFTDVINFGLLLFGTGRAWIDDIQIEILGQDSIPSVTAGPLSDTDLENLICFSDIFGFVRYFHPSKEAQSTNWENFSLLGVQECLGIQVQNHLQNKLTQLYSLVAPGIDIYPLSNVPKAFPKFDKPANALDNVSISWVQTMAGKEGREEKYKSRVVNVYEANKERVASLMQMLRAEEFQGKKVRISAWARSEPIGIESSAQIWLRIDDSTKQILQSVTMDKNPIRNKNWKKYSIEADIPKNAEILRLGLILVGDGKAWFDDVSLSVIDSEGLEGIANPRNNDFEIGKVDDETIRYWIVSPMAKKIGYKVGKTNKNPHAGTQCVIIESDTSSRIRLPEPGEYVNASAGSKLAFTLQISLYLDSLRSLPYPMKEPPSIQVNKPGNFLMNFRDRDSRLATVINIWNYIRHFHLFEFDNKSFRASLNNALKKAALDTTESEFETTLLELTSILGDSQARLWIGEDKNYYGFPFLWEMQGNKLIVKKVLTGLADIEPGDEVVSIDGRKIPDLLNEVGKFISSSNVERRNLIALTILRRGEQMSEQSLGLIKKNGIRADIRLSRNLYMNDIIDIRPDNYTELSPGIVYVDLTRSNDKEVLGNYEILKSAQNIIFDMRGLSASTEYLLGMFSTDKNLESVTWAMPVYTKPDRKLINYNIIKADINPAKDKLTATPYFLIDSRTVGYTEAIAALASYHKIGKTIGKPTAGTAGDIIIQRFPCNTYLSLTAIKGQMPGNDAVLYGKGVQPDIVVKDDIKKTVEGKDTILEQALELIKNKKPGAK